MQAFSHRHGDVSSAWLGGLPRADRVHLDQELVILERDVKSEARTVIFFDTDGPEWEVPSRNNPTQID